MADQDGSPTETSRIMLAIKTDLVGMDGFNETTLMYEFVSYGNCTLVVMLFGYAAAERESFVCRLPDCMQGYSIPEGIWWRVNCFSYDNFVCQP